MIKENDIYTVIGSDYTSEGIGLAKVADFPIFINNLIIGEEAEIKITKVMRKFALGKIIRFINMSPHRITPVIPETIHLGGCQFSQLDYAQEVIYKKRKVERALRVIGGMNIAVSKMHAAPAPNFYRNKTILPLGETKSGTIISGLYRYRTKDIVIMPKTHLDDERVTPIMDMIKTLMPVFNLRPYHEKDRMGDIHKVMIRTSYYLNEIMVVLIVKDKNIANLPPFVTSLVEKCPQITTVILNVNPRDTNVNLGDKEIILYGPGTIKDKINDLVFTISSKSFFQINTPQAEKLYARAIALAELTKNDVVLDAYSGIGTITLLAAQKAKSAIGVEIVKEAVSDAKLNAKQNKVNNVTFFTDDAGDFLAKYKDLHNINVVFVDPPRKGLSSEFIAHLLKAKPEKLIYVSCDPATLARDLKLLEAKYEIKALEALDMFPRTPHVENIVRLHIK